MADGEHPKLLSSSDLPPSAQGMDWSAATVSKQPKWLYGGILQRQADSTTRVAIVKRSHSRSKTRTDGKRGESSRGSQRVRRSG